MELELGPEWSKPWSDAENCVWGRTTPEGVELRSDADPGRTLKVAPHEWQAFVDGLRATQGYGA